MRASVLQLRAIAALHMQPVFVHPDPIFVGLKKSILEDAGIACFIQNESTSATFGAGMLGLVKSAVFDPTLCIVDDARYEEAIALLNTIPEPGARAEDWKCPRCGESVPANFGACWNCSYDSTEATETTEA
jgi:hypothetical protein